MSREREELRFLVGQLRGELRRQERQGRTHLVDPELARWVRQPAGATEAAPRAAAAPGKARTLPAPPPAAMMPRPGAPAAAASPGRSAAPPGVTKSQRPGPPATASARPAPPADPVRPFNVEAPGATQRAAKALSRVPAPGRTPEELRAMGQGLADLGAEAAACRKCGLCDGRTTVVFGSGTAHFPLLFVGEAPGFNEDQQGLPFVGQAGKLLTDIIAAMGFDRKDVYIANVLKCRPPENRDPLPHEIEACRPWLEQQIELIRPRVICTVGKYSAQLLSGAGPKATIGSLRGKVFRYQGIPVVPTYHPAFLLRSPSFKRATWEDVQLVRELYLAAEPGAAAPGAAETAAADAPGGGA